MKLDITISVGDILSAVVIVTAIIALYFQARSVRISEQQLKANVDDVKALSIETKTVADQIKKEREIREEMSIKIMEEYAEQMNYTSHVYGESLDFYRAIQSQTREYIMSLNMGMQILVDELRKNEDVNQKSQKTVHLEQTLKYMMSFMAVSQLWSNELQKVSHESEVRRDNFNKKDDYAKELTKLLAEENGRLKQQINEINKKYGELVTTPRDNFRKSIADLLQQLSNNK